MRYIWSVHIYWQWSFIQGILLKQAHHLHIGSHHIYIFLHYFFTWSFFYSQLFGEEDGEEDISPCIDDPGIAAGNTAVEEPASKPAGIRTAWRDPALTLSSDAGHTEAVIVGHTERHSIRQWAEQAGYSPHALFTKVHIIIDCVALAKQGDNR